METLNTNDIMPHRITYTIELILAGITMLSSFISGNYLTDLLLGIVTYTSARLFYYYFGVRIKAFINKIKLKFKK